MSLFLTEEEMKIQADPKNWRKGIAPRQAKDIFSSPRTVDNERVFQYTTKVPPRPTIKVPVLEDTEDDPPYAPKTP